MGKQHTIEVECSSCKGTGLYSGMAEKDGAYVICTTCRGTGKTTITYNEFDGIKINPKCKRVYKSSMGYVISDKDVVTKDGKLLPFSKAGVSYDEWLNGKDPKHMDFLGCPMLADQGACHDITGFTDTCNEVNGGWLSYIPNCKNASKSHECWSRFLSGQVKQKLDK